MTRFCPVDTSLKFAGKLYKHAVSVKSKRDANTRAEAYRKIGMNARVVTYNKTPSKNSPKIYAVYVKTK